MGGSMTTSYGDEQAETGLKLLEIALIAFNRAGFKNTAARVRGSIRSCKETMERIEFEDRQRIYEGYLGRPSPTGDDVPRPDDVRLAKVTGDEPIFNVMSIQVDDHPAGCPGHDNVATGEIPGNH
jgi:hypothetical protein